MMRPTSVFCLALLAAACKPADDTSGPGKRSEAVGTAAAAELPPPVPARDVVGSVVRVNSTRQEWNPWQPWEKNPPQLRRALGAITANRRVLTTAEMVADATYLEFESPDGTRFCTAKVAVVDYEANLALLEPAPGADADAFFKDTSPLEVAEPAGLGDKLDVIQIEDNGLPLRTTGIIQSVDVTSTFLPEHSFLAYRVKASMQSAASSYTLPVLRDDKLAGLLVSYNSKDQLCDVSGTEIVRSFLADAEDGAYAGFPSLGVAVSRTEDPSFRAWLKLADDQGGLYIRSVRRKSAAEDAGLKKGDVLLSIDGMKIDRRGYYQHPLYGNLFWGHLIRGLKSPGETVKLDLLREGEPLELTATLSRPDEDLLVVPHQTFDKAPPYLVKGGLIFQELSRPLLQAFGDKWESRAPLDLLDAYENPEKYEGKVDRVVFLSGVIPTPATVGYERLRNLIVTSVNGKPVGDIKSLVEAFDGNTDELHSIVFAPEDLTVHIDDTVSTMVDSQLLQRGINRLSRVR